MQRPRWRITGNRSELLLSLWGDDFVGDGPPLAAAEAIRALDAILEASPRWSIAARELSDATRTLRLRGDVSGAAAALGAREAFREAIERGRVRAWRAEVHNLATLEPTELDTETLMSIPLASALLPRTWIEIELTDMEGNPRAGERYWIKLPDGAVREGALDRHGRAYFGDLDPGTAEIRWPDLDEEATVPVTHATSAPRPPPERDWIEIELTDMEGNPRAGERYWIKLPDGAVRQGHLDATGRAYFGDLDPGECEVRWPDLDDEAQIAGGDVTVGHPEETDEDPVALAQAEALINAAREGVPFCEECERARRQREASARAATA